MKRGGKGRKREERKGAMEGRKEKEGREKGRGGGDIGHIPYFIAHKTTCA